MVSEEAQYIARSQRLSGYGFNPMNRYVLPQFALHHLEQHLRRNIQTYRRAVEGLRR